MTKTHEKLVLIHIDEVRRDFITYSCLGMLLADRGWTVQFSNRTDMAKKLCELRPHAFICHNYDLMMNMIDQVKMHTKLFIIPGEGYWSHAPFVKWVYWREGFERQLADIEKIFVWGNSQRDVLIDYGIFREEQIVVAGNPRHDLLTVIDRHRLIVPTLPVGMISNLSLLNPHSGQSILQSIDALRDCHGGYYPDNRNVEDIYWTYVANARVTFELLDRLTKNSTHAVCYRPHQRENMLGYGYLLSKYGDRLLLDKQEFHEFLFSAKVITGFSSTALLEAMMLGKPTLFLGGTDYQRTKEHYDMPNYFYEFLDYCIQPTTVDDMMDYIESACRGEKVPVTTNAEALRKHLRDKMNYPREEYALQRIAREIDAACNNTGRCAEPWGLRRRTGEYVRHLSHDPRRSNWVNNNYCPWCHGALRAKAEAIYPYLRGAR